MRVRLRLLVATAALMLIAAACGADPADQTSGEPAAGEQAEGDSFTVVAYQREDVLGGPEVTLDSLLGRGMPVVVNFWAAQCPPCLVEMPWFDATWQDYQDTVLLIGVDVGPFTGLGSNEQGAQLLDDLDISYPAGYAVDDSPLRQLNVTSMPYTVFFDGDGEIVSRHGGIITEDQMREQFAALVSEAE